MRLPTNNGYLLVLLLLCACTDTQNEITEREVVDFLHRLEQLAVQRDFDLLAPNIHERAYFRFNDGDFRGIAEIRRAFEKTWETTSNAAEDKYYLTDIVVLSTDQNSAAATYTYNWEGKFGNQEFSIQGRGTRVLSRTESGDLQIVLEHLSRLAE